MSEIDNINRFLNECGTFTMITSLNGRGTGRPFEYHVIKDGKLYFMVGKHKDVYRQMELDNNVEIVGYQDSNWIRYYGRAVCCQDEDMFEEMMRAIPLLENLYTSSEDVVFFYLTEATVEYHVQWDLKSTAKVR